MGVVYSGVHPVIGKEVAIKVLSPNLSHTPDLIARFIQEARAVNQIGHPNIIDIFAFGESPELGHYFVMPMLKGEDLRQRVERTGPIPLQSAIKITEQICDALDAAHENRIFHRDLKPDNIYLVPTRRGGDTVKVLDFGIAKLSNDDSITVTRTGAHMGTPLFMSPEQWEGVGVDHRTDIYALGILFHYMVTGRFPFESNSAVALMRMHCDQEPVPPSAHGAPPSLDAPIAQALSKRPDHRFDTARAFGAALTTASGISSQAPTAVARQIPAALAPAAPTPVPVPVTDPGTERPARSFIPWLLAAAVVTGGLVAFAVLSGGGSESNDVDAGAATTAAPASADAAVAKAPVSDAAIASVRPPPPTPPEVPKVQIVVKSIPPGAMIVSEGLEVGLTPMTIKMPRSKNRRQLILRKDGFRDSTIKFHATKSRAISKRLRRVRGAPNRPSDTTKPPRPSDETRPPKAPKDSKPEEEKWGEPTNPFPGSKP